MRRLLGIVLAMALIAMFGLTGCKNTCQKAAGHLMDCVQSYCADHEDNTQCNDEMLTSLEATFNTMASECTEEMAQESEETLNKSCEEIAVMMGYAEPTAEGGEE